MIYHCRAFDADGNVIVRSFRDDEVRFVSSAPGVSVSHLVLPDGNFCFYWASIDNSEGQIPRFLNKRWPHWKKLVKEDPNRQPPCFLAPDGKIYRSSDYQEVF